MRNDVDPGEGSLRLPPDFRRFLPRLKGSRASVFLALAARADGTGWANPTIDTIMADTGLTHRGTVCRALRELESCEIDGRRLLLVQRQRHAGHFAANRYLVFPPGDGSPVAVEETIAGQVDDQESTAAHRSGEDRPAGDDRSQPPAAASKRMHRLLDYLRNQNIELAEGLPSIILRLGDEGIESVSVRLRLVSEHTPEEIARQILWIDRRRYHDRGALLAAAIASRWGPPCRKDVDETTLAWEYHNAVALVDLYSYEP